MAGKRSAGILVFRRTNGQVEVLIAHMGGPLWARRDAGAWSIPKGEYEPDETAEAAARREFQEDYFLIDVIEFAGLANFLSIVSDDARIAAGFAATAPMPRRE